MARKTSRKETTVKRYTKVPPTVKPEAPKATPAAPVVKAVADTAAAVKTTPIIAAKAGDATTAVPCSMASTKDETKVTCCGETTMRAAVTADQTTVPALLQSLHDSDADVAREAATALGLTGDKSAVQPLIDALNNTDGFYHTVVRAAAASSLGQLGDGRAVQPLLDAIADPIAEASAEAIRALATLGDRRAVDALIDVVRNPTGFFLATSRRAAVIALAKLGGEAAIAEICSVAADSNEDPVIREAAETATKEKAVVTV